MKEFTDISANTAEETETLEQYYRTLLNLPEGGFLTRLEDLSDLGSLVDNHLTCPDLVSLQVVPRLEEYLPPRIEVRSRACCVGYLPSDVAERLLPLIIGKAEVKAVATRIHRKNGNLADVQMYVCDEDGHDLRFYVFGHKGVR